MPPTTPVDQRLKVSPDDESVVGRRNSYYAADEAIQVVTHPTLGRRRRHPVDGAAYRSGPTPHLRPWLALAALGTGAAYVINYALIRTEGAAGASVVTYLVPVTSIALGAALLAEQLTLNMLAGALGILVGVAIAGRSSST